MDKPRVVVRRTPDGELEVVEPEQLGQGPFTETVGATERPPEPADPRTGNEQRMPGLPGGIG